MPDLIITIAEEKQKQHAEAIINQGEWDEIFAISADTAIVQTQKKIHYMRLDLKKPLEACIEDLKKELKLKCSGFDVAINLFSGTGKLHMATLSCVMKLGMGFRLIIITPSGIKEV